VTIVTAFIALLRAINVGGTGKLPMTDLKQLCTSAGFDAVQTYIASGNVVFNSGLSEAEVKAKLEASLSAYADRSMSVAIRTAEEMAEVLRENPFGDADPRHTVAVFLDSPPPGDALASLVAPDGEQAALGKREIYIAYGETMGRSKLRLPAARSGTARNMNTVAKLVAMAASNSNAKKPPRP
jgi:uncharacterized protein (DUF1697 family)